MRSPPSSSSFCCRYFMHAITDSSFFTGPLALAWLGPCAAECPDASAAATSTGSTAIRVGSRRALLAAYRRGRAWEPFEGSHLGSGRRIGCLLWQGQRRQRTGSRFMKAGSGLRQRNEFLVVAWNQRERAVGRAAPFAPVALRLFDARLRAGDEVPPDVA